MDTMSPAAPRRLAAGADCDAVRLGFLHSAGQHHQHQGAGALLFNISDDGESGGGVWSFCTHKADMIVTLSAALMQDLADLISALLPSARPLKIVWCVPRRLWDSWLAPAIEGPICHRPQHSGPGATAADIEAVQQYVLCVTLRQRNAQQSGFEWV